MAEKAHAIIVLLRWLVVIFILATIFTIFVYSPFYSKSALWVLDRFVNERVDPVAAQSQKSGKLNLESNLEPGSPEWVARRAYLAEVNRTLENGNGSEFIHLQHRYQLLLKMIEEQKQQEQNDSFQLQTQTSQSDETEDDEEQQQVIDFYHQLMNEENEPLLQQYREFLSSQENLLNMPQEDEEETGSAKKFDSPFILQRPAHQPHAIVILGGGLTSGEKKGEIVVNAYTRKRLEQAIEIYKKHHLPIVLSGVEAPYMQKWLEQHQIQAQFLENRSMNTCENTRFSSLLLQKQGGAPTVFLVTDAYHMPRSQRLFAINGIATIPVIAPLPNTLTEWQPAYQNLMHSRRATYEVLATLRDVWFGESNCREIP